MSPGPQPAVEGTGSEAEGPRDPRVAPVARAEDAGSTWGLHVSEAGRAPGDGWANEGLSPDPAGGPAVAGAVGATDDRWAGDGRDGDRRSDTGETAFLKVPGRPVEPGVGSAPAASASGGLGPAERHATVAGPGGTLLGSVAVPGERQSSVPAAPAEQEDRRGRPSSVPSVPGEREGRQPPAPSGPGERGQARSAVPNAAPERGRRQSSTSPAPLGPSDRRGSPPVRGQRTAAMPAAPPEGQPPGPGRGAELPVGPVPPLPLGSRDGRGRPSGARVARGRRTRRVVRKVDVWTVFKMSLLFYLCIFLVLLIAGIVLWNIADAFNVIHSIEKFIRSLFDLSKFTFHPGVVLESAALGGLILVLMGTGANVLIAVLYNLISDVVGGVQFIVLEETSTSE